MKINHSAAEQCQASIDRQNLEAKASNYAKEQLLRLGRGYPMFNPNLTPEENHKAITDYSTLEASYIQEFIAKHGPQKATQPPESKPKVDKWARPYYDD